MEAQSISANRSISARNERSLQEPSEEIEPSLAIVVFRIDGFENSTKSRAIALTFLYIENLEGRYFARFLYEEIYYTII